MKHFSQKLTEQRTKNYLKKYKERLQLQIIVFLLPGGGVVTNNYFVFF